MFRSFLCLGAVLAGLQLVSAQVPMQTGPPIGPPSNISQGSSVPHVDDKKFLRDATLDGLTEIELGKLAVEKASNPKVKDFGQRMIEEYTAAHQQILRVAADETVPVPKTIDPKHQQRVDRLAKLSGKDFDRAYIQDELRQRRQDVKEFTNASLGASDPNLKSFANTNLPTLEDHLNALKVLEKSVR